MIQEHVLQLRLKYYDDNAVKVSTFFFYRYFSKDFNIQIQKIWRGFYVRKYVLDYYSRKRYLAGLEQKNDQIR